MKDKDLLAILVHLIGLESALSRRNIRVGREHFFGAVQLISKALDQRRRGRR